MILVTGANGKTGQAIIKWLSKVENVCAFVHQEEHVRIVKSLGAQKVIVGDMHSEPVVRSAMQNVRAVYHICPNMSPDEKVIGSLVIKEARQAGVAQFVYHSVLHPQTEKMNHHWQKLRVEEILLESGLPFTILQSAPYMQNLLAGWKSILENSVLRVPYSVHSKFSFVDLEDVAEAAKIILSESIHKYATYELAGTLPMSYVKVAEIVSNALNRDIWAEKEEIRDWRLHVNRLDEYALENLIKMFEYYDQWGLAGSPNVLKWILKREPTSFESFIQRALKERNAIH